MPSALAPEKREYHKEQLKYRSEKRWRIFDWATKLLVATIAGGVAIDLGPKLGCVQRVALSVAVSFLGAYAAIWLWRNNDALAKSRKALEHPEPEVRWYLWLFSYEATVIVLAAVSVFIIALAA